MRWCVQWTRVIFARVSLVYFSAAALTYLYFPFPDCHIFHFHSPARKKGQPSHQKGARQGGGGL